MAATKEGAARLRDALHRAMAGKGITSWEGLARASGVSSTTIENWVYARTEPRAKQLIAVGEALSPFTSALDLSAAYYGVTAAGPSSVQDALERHTAAVERQNELLTRLITALGSGAALVGQALGSEERE